MEAEEAPKILGTALKASPVDERLTRSIIGCFYTVYNALGYGFFEKVYQEALVVELREKGHRVLREVPANIFYKGRLLGQYKTDVVVDDQVVVEVKSTHRLSRG